MAGLLIDSVEYAIGLRHDAETTRRSALSIGAETDNAGVSACAHEVRAWIPLTTGNYHGVVVAAQHGAGGGGVSRCRGAAGCAGS